MPLQSLVVPHLATNAKSGGLLTSLAVAVDAGDAFPIIDIAAIEARKATACSVAGETQIESATLAGGGPVTRDHKVVRFAGEAVVSITAQAMRGAGSTNLYRLAVRDWIIT